jgi:cyclopropane fatty-acyl-phospholipid synthase-like methyltransferase
MIYHDYAGSKSGYDGYETTEEMVRQQIAGIILSVAPQIGHPATALDVACAYGFGVREFCMSGIDGYGIDVSQYAIDKSNEYMAGLGAHRTRVGDAIDPMAWKLLPLQTYDLVTASEFFEHIPSDKVDTVLKNMQLHARYGFFVINGSTAPDQPHDTDGDCGHLNHHSMDWWIQIIAKYGQIDFESMHRFSYWAHQYGYEDVGWHSRSVAVKFNLTT